MDTDAIEKVLAAHQLRHGQICKCTCGIELPATCREAHCAHVAAQIKAALDAAEKERG